MRSTRLTNWIFQLVSSMTFKIKESLSLFRRSCQVSHAPDVENILKFPMQQALPERNISFGTRPILSKEFQLKIARLRS